VDASTAATIAATSVTGAGTIALFVVASLQFRRERKRQEREDTPTLFLTGARAGRHGQPGPYTVDLVNWSARAIWLDGVYAKWYRPQRGDGRLRMEHTNHTRHRTPVGPGGWVTLVKPFIKQPSEDASEEDLQTEVVAWFYYGPGETEPHWSAWRIKGESHAVHVERLKELPRWCVQRQEALAGPRAGEQAGPEEAWADWQSASSSAVQVSSGVVAGGDDDER